jgi:hypothetical protein
MLNKITVQPGAARQTEIIACSFSSSNDLVLAVIADTCYPAASKTAPKAGSKSPLAAKLVAVARGVVVDARSIFGKEGRAARRAAKTAANKECDMPATCSPACPASSPDNAHGDNTAAAPGKPAKHHRLHLVFA